MALLVPDDSLLCMSSAKKYILSRQKNKCFNQMMCLHLMEPYRTHPNILFTYLSGFVMLGLRNLGYIPFKKKIYKMKDVNVKSMIIAGLVHWRSTLSTGNRRFWVQIWQTWSIDVDPPAELIPVPEHGVQLLVEDLLNERQVRRLLEVVVTTGFS